MVHRITSENADRIRTWFKERGGIAIWNSADLSNPDQTWTTPLKTADGKTPEKPHWAAGKIEQIITNPDEVVVDTPKEIKRFHVAVRMGGNGFTAKLTDASSAKVRKEVAKAGENAWYEFDYSSQEAVIMIAGETRKLLA